MGGIGLKRDRKCAQLGLSLVDQDVTLAGWVNVVRDLGGIIFVELRDSTGRVQLIADPNKNKEIHEHFIGLKSEYVIAVKGKVSKRPEGTAKAEDGAGAIEIYPHQFELLNTCRPLPFQLDQGDKVDEALRLKYRYLDLRRPEMNNNLVVRHKVTQAIRTHLDGEGFIEVETCLFCAKPLPKGLATFSCPAE